MRQYHRERRRHAFRSQCKKNGSIVMNTMGIVAREAAYRHCEPWADAMLDYVRGTQSHFARRVKDLPLHVTAMDALYLAWIDCRRIGKPVAELHDFFLRRARVWLDPGGEGFMRINLACPRILADEAISRLAEAVHSTKALPA